MNEDRRRERRGRPKNPIEKLSFHSVGSGIGAPDTSN